MLVFPCYCLSRPLSNPILKDIADIHTNPITGEALNRADNGPVEHIRDDTAVFLLTLVLWRGECGHRCGKAEREREKCETSALRYVSKDRHGIALTLDITASEYLSCVRSSGSASLRQLWAGCWTFWECGPPLGLDSVVLCCWTFGCLGRNLVEEQPKC